VLPFPDPMTPNDATAGETIEASSRLRAFFVAAAELDEPARSTWIDANVADAAERARLVALLAADATDGGYLATPASDHLAQLDAEAVVAPATLLGQRIGAFRLVRSLGKGGMAEVFLGERDGGDFIQRAAVKLLRRGLYSELEQRLFRRERQLLAGLDHPNIARLIDGGVTAAGIPYLALEFVAGEPITRYATQRRLPVRARVELFLVVCRAVDAAHRALIVHRDIKPSNIIVGADGTVKLLDFGIAKLLEDDVEAPTVGVFTPDYAAPEQLAGAAVTTATDVYALGVLLHELLLGERPRGEATQRPSSLARAGAARNVAAVPNPAALPRELRGDLDTIVLKCLAAEPERRYASAAVLADDVQRYLAGRPVEAHPPSLLYRARKFAQRHRGSVALGAGLLLAILGGLAIAFWEARIARHEAARANHVREFVEDMFAPIDNSVIEGRQTSVHDLLASATAKLGRSSDLDVAERVDLQMLFSRLHEKIGESDQALALARQAAELASARLGADAPAALAAQIAYAQALLEHDDARAGPMLKSLEAQAQAQRTLRGMPLVQLYDGLADSADRAGSHDVALAYEQRALAERVAQSGADSAMAATGYNNVAISLDLSGHHGEAIDAFQRSYAIHLANEGVDSFETANARNNLAMAEMQAGRLQAARDDFLAVEPLFEAAPNNKRSRNARYWQDRCQLAIVTGEAARPICDRALQATTEILKPDNVHWFSRALRLHAQMQSDRGDFAAGRDDLQRADAVLGPGGEPMALGMNGYLRAEIDIAAGDLAQAARELAPAIERIDHAFPEYLRLRALAARALACSSAGRGDPTCPVGAATAARAALDADANRWNPWLLPAHVALARVDIEAGRADAAAGRLRDAIAQAEHEVDAAQIHLRLARAWLSVAAAVGGRCNDAQASWRRASAAVAEPVSDTDARFAAARARLRATACWAGIAAGN
jgi:serine/threonine-protein kinase